MRVQKFKLHKCIVLTARQSACVLSGLPMLISNDINEKGVEMLRKYLEIPLFFCKVK